MRALLLALGLIACGGSTPEPRPASAPLPPPAPAAPAPAARPNGTLGRAEVVSFVNSGFYQFLQRVEVEPSLDDGRFRGWLIVSLRPPTFWQGVDLAPGDIVTNVNGLPIERETEAYDAFQSLKTAQALDVSFVRGGAEHRISFKIVD